MNELGDCSTPAAGDEIRVLFVQGSNPAVTCPESEARARGLGPRRPVHRRARPGAHRHRSLRRRRASRDDALRGRRPRRVVRHVRPAARRRGDRPSRREPHERRGRLRGSRRGSGSRAERFDSDPDRAHGARVSAARRLRTPARPRCCASPARPCSSATRSPASTTARRGSRRRCCASGRCRRTSRSSPSYPLALITPGDASHDQLDVRRVQRGRGRACASHPTTPAPVAWPTATSCGCGTTRPRSEVVARLDADLRPGVVSMPKGLWCRDVAGRPHRQRASCPTR